MNFADDAAGHLHGRGPLPRQRRQRVANCNTKRPKLFLNFLDWKCRNDGELPRKNHDFFLKNGHLF